VSPQPRILAHVEQDYRRKTQKSFITAGAINYAKPFYEKNGYVLVSEEKDWDGSQYYWLRKDF
jgi:hypothetical protein